MNPPRPDLRLSPVVVIGAGMCGLSAASALSAGGVEVIVLETSDRPGGRLATSRLGEATLDSGAQFFTARSAEMIALTKDWLSDGTAYEWCRGFDQPPARPDGHPRYAGTGGMARIAERLGRGLDVRVNHDVVAIRAQDGPTWSVETEGRPPLRSAGVLLTPPVPDALAMLRAGGTKLSRPTTDALGQVRYEPVLAALVRLVQPSAIPPPGGVQLGDGPFSWVGDNQAKGISATPAVTLHAAGELSQRRWPDADSDVLTGLLRLGRRWLGGAEIADARLRRWALARPLVLHPDPYLVAVDGPAPLILAGDGFGSARVEGAALSGWAAAGALAARLG